MERRPADYFRAPPAAGSPYPEDPGRRLRPFAAAVQLLLFATVVLAVVLAIDIGRRLSVFNDVIDHPSRAGLRKIDKWDDTVHDAAVTYTVAFLITAVAWVVWFFIARTAAGRRHEHLMRFGRGWAIGSWFTPILSFWRPFQISTDVLNGFQTPPGSWQPERRYRALLGTWWAFFIVQGLSIRLLGRGADTVSAFRTNADIELVWCAVVVVAGLLAICVVEVITSAGDRQRSRLLEAPPGPFPAG